MESLQKTKFQGYTIALMKLERYLALSRVTWSLFSDYLSYVLIISPPIVKYSSVFL